MGYKKNIYTDNIRQVERKQYGTDKRISLQSFRSWQDGMGGFKPVAPHNYFNNQWRLSALAIVFLLVSLILVGRLFMLQVVKGEEYYIRSERNRVYLKTVIPERGVIYDRHGEVLARNAPAFSVGIVFSEIPLDKQDYIITTLAEDLGIERQELWDSFIFASQQPNTETIVQKYITYEQQLALKVKSFELPGVFIIEDMTRQYPQGELFSAVIGYTSEISSQELEDSNSENYTLKSYTGKAGIEREYEEYLTGQLGKEIIEIEANGKVTSESQLIEAIPGEDLTVTLDSSVQRKAGELLDLALTKYDATGGSIIVMVPKTGEVLAMVSLPTYDNNVFSDPDGEVTRILQDPRGLLLNRSISGLYAPGSIVKMALGAQALQDGIITPDSQISSDPQVIRVGGWEFPDWTYSWGRGPYGTMNLPAAISVSSDTFFYKIGGGYPPSCGDGGEKCQVTGMGVNGVVKALRNFGFGSLTGIDLPGEAAGLVPDPAWKQKERGEEWYLGNTYHLSIGQGDMLATPLQVINGTNIIATDAKTMKPHLIADTQIASDKGYTQGQDKPVYLENLRVAREGMVEAVTQGIVYPLRYVPVSVAAKTGTAEFGSLNAKGEYDTHAWVTGFAPITDPQMSFVIMLESGGGSTNAAEVAAELVTWFFESYTVDN